MSKQSDLISHRMRLLLLVGIACLLVVACGGPTPTPQMVVVTATFTPEPEVVVVTATFTPTTEVVSTDTPSPTSTPSPSDTPLPSDTPPPTHTAPPLPTATPVPTQPAAPTAAPVKYFRYDHLSGVFSLDVPVEADFEEDEEGLYYTFDESLFMFFFTVLDTVLDAGDLENLVPVVMDSALVGEGLISSYDDLVIERNDANNAVASAFSATSEEMGQGEGSLILWSMDETLLMMILLTSDYGQIEEVWQTTLDSISASPVEAPAPPPPPPTHAPTPKPPTPKPTATTAPAPPPQNNKACYLIENHLGADLTITFTARDREWAETIGIGANDSKEYCLDPGRYTYTLDAPPPWGSTNGELTANAGDRFRWPIRGE